MTPSVSVVIPAYNYAEFLCEAVDSVLAQTVLPLEVIVIDDGSTDNSREVMEVYSGNPIVRYIFQENRGLSGARNTGIREAKGEWIGLLDADDVWSPEKLEQQLAVIPRYPDVGLVATQAYWMDKAGRRLSSPATSDIGECTELGLHELLQFTAFNPSSVIFRKTVCEAVGLFDEQLRYVEDLDMWLRVAARYRVVRLNTSLLGYRVHSRTRSMHSNPNLQHYQRVVEKAFCTIPELRSHSHWRCIPEARMFNNISWMRYMEGNRIEAIGDAIRSILRWPFALKNPHGIKQRLDRAKRLARYALVAPPKEGH